MAKPPVKTWREYCSMYDLSWPVIVFYSVPECFLIILIGLYLVNYRTPLLPITYTSLVFASFSYIIWHLDIPFGFHTILQTMVIVVLIHFFTRISPVKCVIAVSAGVIIKITLEVILQPVLTYVTGIDYRQIIQVPVYMVLFPLPGLMVMGALYYLLKCKSLYLFNSE